MRRIFIGLLILTILLASLIPISYAIEVKEKNFFEVNKQEIASGETLELIVNLGNIEYDKSLLTITTNINVSGIYKKDDSVELVKIDSNTIQIEIDKQTINSNQIKFYYDVSNLEAGSTINLEAIVQNSDNQGASVQKNITVTIIEERQENNEEIENKEEQNQGKDSINVKERSQNKPDGSEQVNDDKQKMSSNMQLQQDLNTKYSTKTSTFVKTSSINSENKETVTYNGSDNNYLSELSVDNYELNKDFNKESSTYFVTVDKDVSDIKINVIAEDDSSIVCITGNTNLGSGTNKILITVTAENGSVRNYKIYVTKNS